MKAPEFDGIDKPHAYIDITIVAYGRKYQLIFKMVMMKKRPSA